MLPPLRIKPSPLIDLWFQVQHFPFWANLASDLVGINRAWPYKSEPKVSVIQANAQLAKKGVLDLDAWIQYSLGANSLLLECFVFT